VIAYVPSSTSSAAKCCELPEYRCFYPFSHLVNAHQFCIPKLVLIIHPCDENVQQVADPGFSETGGASTRGKANVPGPREIWTMVVNSPKGKHKFEKKTQPKGDRGGLQPPQPRP